MNKTSQRRSSGLPMDDRADTQTRSEWLGTGSTRSGTTGVYAVMKPPFEAMPRSLSGRMNKSAGSKSN